MRVQALRAFLYGFGAVLLGSVLAAQGFSSAGAGGIFTAMLAGMAAASFAVGRWGHRLRRRSLYVVLLLLMGGSGAVFGLTTWVPLLVLAAATGTLSTDANESGPITTVEQATLSDAPAATRPRVFGSYNAVAYLAGSAGSLAAAGPSALRHVLPAAPGEQRWLLAFPVLAVACALVARRLPERAHPVSAGEPLPHLARSRRSVRRLSLLFAVDSFGGGLVVASFIVFWFERRYGASAETMGLVLFAAGILQAGSSLLAGRLALRIGLLQTMVFTHLPSNLLLAAVPFMPNLGLAVLLLLLRFAVSQMDVPARQAFIAAIVDPHERVAAAAYTNTARYLSRPAGPVVAGALMQRTALGAPFVAAGLIKVLYDLTIYALFRALATGAAGSRG
jgi:predicted MFS family arabinose efflux permease